MKRILLFSLSSLLALAPDLRAAAPAGKTQQLSSPDQVPDGLSKSDWTSIRAAYEAGRHAFMPVAEGWQARNPGQQWLTRFDRRGFVAEPAAGGWQWGLELKRYGFPGRERTITSVPAVKAEGQRLAYAWDAVVEEWFVNDRRGLEHGFTLRERPTAGADPEARLQFDLAVRGGLRPEVTAGGQGIRFVNDSGAAVVTYAGLKVWDADGKILSAQLELSETGIRVSLDERGARYPITVDPIAQQAYLKASSPVAGDSFGSAVSISGDTLVVGAPLEDGTGTGSDPAPDSGAAYVFVRSGASWIQQAYLKAANVGFSDNFGAAVAVTGDTLVIGAPNEDGSGSGVNPPDNNSASSAGAAYVFVRAGTTWSQQAYLKASNPGVGDQFGGSVSVSGDTVIVGAGQEDGSGTGVNPPDDNLAVGAGSAYVFVRSGTIWSQQAQLKASNTGARDLFGKSVAVAGDTVIVGAPAEAGSGLGVNPPNDNLAFQAGAAYVFVRSGAAWSQQAYLKASNTGASDQFGSSVAVSGETVVIGAFFERGSGTGVNPPDDDLAIGAGAAYVFVRSGTVWNQQAYLKASNTDAADQFGSSVAIAGDTVVIAARLEDGSGTGVNPADDNLALSSGAAYVFARSGTTWSQQAYLKASNTDLGDAFGGGTPVPIADCGGVTVSGDTVVVGAPRESGSGTGVNPADNNLADRAGAAYVFAPSLGINSPPAMTCPSPAVVPCTSPTGGTATVTVSLSDADNDALTVIWSVNNVPVATHTLPAGTTSDSLVNHAFGFGPSLVSVSVTDGNSAPVLCGTTVTVTAHDAPVAILPTLPTLSNDCSVTITAAPLASDPCIPGGIVTGLTTDPLTYTVQGTYTVIWTYTSPHDTSLVTTQLQIVVVRDTTPPTITCPPAISVASGSIPAAATNLSEFIAQGGTVTDNCDPNGTVTSYEDSFGSCPMIVRRTYVVRDAAGNGSSCEQVITVNNLFAEDGIIWHQPLARSGLSEDTDPGNGNTLKYRFKVGSTVPIQVHAQGCSGDVTANANVTGTVVVFGDTDMDGVIDANEGALVIDYNGVGAAGGVMDKVSGHLKFNLDTKLLVQTFKCYILQVTVTDSSTGESRTETVPLQAK